MRVIANDGGSGRGDSWLYCNLCHYLDRLMGCEYTLRSALERSDLVVSFRGAVRVGYSLNSDDASDGCDIHWAHPGLDNERCSKFDVEHGLDAVRATISVAVVIAVEATERQRPEMLAVHCLDYLIQHRGKDHSVGVGEYPVCGDDVGDAMIAAGYVDE